MCQFTDAGEFIGGAYVCVWGGGCVRACVCPDPANTLTHGSFSQTTPQIVFCSYCIALFAIVVQTLNMNEQWENSVDHLLNLFSSQSQKCTLYNILLVSLLIFNWAQSRISHKWRSAITHDSCKAELLILQCIKSSRLRCRTNKYIRKQHSCIVLTSY